MNVLLLTHRVPFPPNRGDRIRAYHVLRFLAQRCDVHLACVTQEHVSCESRRELEKLCAQVAIASTTALGRASRDVWSLATGRSATEGHFWSPNLAATIREWGQHIGFDAVVCICSGMYRYARLKELRGARKVVDLVDVDSQKWMDYAAASTPPQSLLYALEARRVRRLEQTIAREADELVVISEQERSILEQGTRRTDIRVANNGVDTRYFHATAVEPDPATCCFVGVLDYQPNVDGLCWFVRTVWPQVRSRFSTARLQIVGRSPNAAIRRLSTVPGVELHANVPDVRPYISASSIVIAPLRIARGIQNKVLEAMAMQRPVIASTNALTGLTVSPGSDALVADSIEEWSKCVQRLLDDADMRLNVSAAGRAYVEANHCWDHTLYAFAETLTPERRRPSTDAHSPLTELSTA